MGQLKVHLANYEPARHGGGWTFQNNFHKVMGEDITDYEEAGIYFVAGPTMVAREAVERAKADGKKIVLRIDNAVRNSRNRNTGMSRMKDFATWADLVIYQSQWAKDYLMPFTGKDGPVILNGTDIEVFQPATKTPDSYIYSRFNRDETKGWEVARYWFSRQQAGKLYIVGNFSPELVEGNFDFYMGEDYQFIPTLPHDSYASLLNTMQNFIYTYYNDACSNSLIEALCSGCRIVGDMYFRNSGGSPEIITAYETRGRDYFSLERMVNQYRKALESL